MANHHKNSLSVEKKIQNLFFYRKRIHKNSTSSKILQLLYPDKNYTIKQITDGIDKPYNYTKKIVLTIHSEGYVAADSKPYNRSYSLTQMGRWFAICNQLDNIPFQSLCILAEAYSKIKKHPRKYYMISKFKNMFDESYDKDRNCISAIYSPSNISRSVCQLTERSLVYWAFNDILRISSGIFEMLNKKYDKELEALAEWNIKTLDRCKEEYIDNFSFDNNKRQIIALTTKQPERTKLTQ